MGKFLDSKLVQNFFVKNMDTFSYAENFVETLVDELSGKNISGKANVYIDGKQIFLPGELAAKKTAAVVHTITPTQWKRLGVLALTLAGCKIPILATADWNKVVGVAEALQKGGPKTLVNQVDWRGLSNNLIAQKAEAAGVSNETIDEMLDLVNGIIHDYDVPTSTTSENAPNIINSEQHVLPQKQLSINEHSTAVAPPKTTMFCTGCGRKISRTAKFCNFCGNKVNYKG